MKEPTPHPLGERDIDLWLADYRAEFDPALLAGWRALLSPAEQAQQLRFHFEDDRRRYLVTRALVRTVLSLYASRRPADWTFAANAWGRPAIADADADAAGLCFNVSHTRGLIVMGVTRGRELGVDIEDAQARAVSPGLAERYFAPEEAAALAALPAGLQQDRFFEYWTFKEAYIKARGMGLSLPLDGFSFRFPAPGTVSMAIAAELDDDPRRWALMQWRPTARHLLAVCAERHAAGPLRVTLRETVPGQGGRRIDLAPTRVCDATLPPAMTASS